MLAMNDDEVVLMVGMMVTATGIAMMSMHHKARTQRLRTIEKALENGSVDEQTRRNMLELLAADSAHQRAMWQGLVRNSGRVLRVLTFVVGWLTFSIGGIVLIGMLLLDASRYDIQGATIATAIGFGLVSLPLALREVDTRRSVRE